MAGRVSSPVLVGRQAELETIWGLLDRVALGTSGHLLVAGEAGVGKSRLVAEVASLASGRGFRVLRAECVAVGSGILPYGPFVQILRALAEGPDGASVLALAGGGAADLAQLVPAYGRRGGAATAAPEWVQTRLFEALVTLFAKLAARAPLVLVVEDLHWADAATLDALAFVVHALRTVPIATIGTYRTDDLHRRHPLHPWLAELDRAGRSERLELKRLARGDLRAMIAAIDGGEPSGDLVANVFERSDGNPFFAEELLAAHRRGERSVRLTGSLRDILLAHVASVPDTVLPVLRAAAVAGRRISHDLLARVAGLDEADLLPSLRTAVGAGLLVIDGEAEGEGYAFRHALVQEVVYDELLPGDRRGLHRAIAEALEATPADGPAPEAGRLRELAHHWAAARENERAFRASLAAADAARSSFAHRAALHEYERALDLWSDVADPEVTAGVDRLTLLRRAGDAAALAGDHRRSVVHRRAAVESANATGDPLLSGAVHAEMGRSLWQFGDSEAALVAYRAAVATIPTTPPTPALARAVAGLAQILMLRDQFSEARLLAADAVEIARATGAREQEGHALNSLGRCMTFLGECAPGIELLQTALAIAQDLGNADDVGRAYVNLVGALNDCGDSTRAAEVAARGIEVAEALGIAYSYGHYLRLNAATVAYWTGRWEDARRLHEQAAERSPVGAGAELYGHANRLALLVGQGWFDEVDAHLSRALSMADSYRGAQFIGHVHAAATEREIWRRAPQEAVRLAWRGLDSLRATDAQLARGRISRWAAWAAADLAEHGRAHRDAGAAADATDRLASLGDLLAEVREALRPAFTRDLDALDAILRAEVARAAGAPDQRAWATAATLWEQHERPYVVAYARWRQAEAALVDGERAGALDALAAGHAIASRLGARPLREALEELARRARLPIGTRDLTSRTTTRPDRAGPHGLTPRERDVLALVTDGRTNRQIAEALFITESTAGVHVSNILGKLGVRNRGEAAALAFRLGLGGGDTETS